MPRGPIFVQYWKHDEVYWIFEIFALIRTFMGRTYQTFRCTWQQMADERIFTQRRSQHTRWHSQLMRKWHSWGEDKTFTEKMKVSEKKRQNSRWKRSKFLRNKQDFLLSDETFPFRYDFHERPQREDRKRLLGPSDGNAVRICLKFFLSEFIVWPGLLPRKNVVRLFESRCLQNYLDGIPGKKQSVWIPITQKSS